MKMQSLALLLFLAIALVATQSTQTDMDLKPFSRKEEQQQMRAEAVVHNRRGANGSGSDLSAKPSQDKNGAIDLPVGVASFCVSMVVSCFFFLLQL